MNKGFDTNVDTARVVLASDGKAANRYVQKTDDNPRFWIEGELPDHEGERHTEWDVTNPVDGVLVYTSDTQDPQNLIQQVSGGEKKMAASGDDYFNRRVDSLADTLEESGNVNEEVVAQARNYEQQFDDIAEAAEELIDEYRDAGIGITDEVETWAQDQIRQLEETEESLYGIGRRLAELDRDYISDSSYGGVDISPLEDLNN